MASVRAVVALHQTAAAAGLASLPQTEGLRSPISSVVARRNVSCSLRQAIISADLCGLAAQRRCGCSCTSAVLGVKLLRPKGGVRNVRVHRSGSFRCKVSDGVSGNEEKKSGGDGEEDREGLASDITRILLITCFLVLFTLFFSAHENPLHLVMTDSGKLFLLAIVVCKNPTNSME
jgi:hypothetical protein